MKSNSSYSVRASSSSGCRNALCCLHESDCNTPLCVPLASSSPTGHPGGLRRPPRGLCLTLPHPSLPTVLRLGEMSPTVEKERNGHAESDREAGFESRAHACCINLMVKRQGSGRTDWWLPRGWGRDGVGVWD